MQYELMTIAHIDGGEDGATQLKESIIDKIAELGGAIDDVENWGKRTFAYPIKGTTEGFYAVIDFRLPADKLSELKKELNKWEDNLLRYLITAGKVLEPAKKRYKVEISEAHYYEVEATDKSEARQEALNLFNGGNMHEDIRFGEVERL